MANFIVRSPVATAHRPSVLENLLSSPVAFLRAFAGYRDQMGPVTGTTDEFLGIATQLVAPGGPLGRLWYVVEHGGTYLFYNRQTGQLVHQLTIPAAIAVPPMWAKDP